MEPEAITDGERGCFASEDEMPTGRQILKALKLDGGGEGEEVDTAKNSWRKAEEEDGCRQSGGHVPKIGLGDRGNSRVRLER